MQGYQDVLRLCVYVCIYMDISYIMLVIFSMRIHHIFHFTHSMELKAVFNDSFYLIL